MTAPSELPKRWVIFDADNTLWGTEQIYDTSRREACEFIATKSGASFEEIERYQREHDVQLNGTYGYSSSRFPRSIEDTYCKFVDLPDSHEIRHVRRLAEAVFEKKADIYQGVESVLRSLHASGFLLGLLTAGEIWVQKKRITEFHLQGIFKAIEVVETKDAAAFNEFCRKYHIEKSVCWVVGDSIRSDILPAMQAGLKPIWVRHANWSERENIATLNSDEFVGIDAVAEVLDCLDVPIVDPRPVAHETFPAFAIFEGGGAKGVAHVGALKALEERKALVQGVAGASAGSIVAGLIASGYRADELFKPDESTGKPFEMPFLEILGRERWVEGEAVIEDLRQRIDGLLASSGHIGLVAILWRWLRLGGALRRSVPGIRRALDRRGYFDTDQFVDWYNSLLRARVTPAEGEFVRFKDLDFDLKIVSSDVTNSALVVHSRDSDPDEPVAHAVAASISIPLFFSPFRRAQGGITTLHVDGGLLSNFPAWLFGDASPEARDVPVLGFELRNASPVSAALDPVGYVGALLSTAVSGKRPLEVRGLEHLHSIPLPVTVGSFDFARADTAKLETYREGYNAARAYFRQELPLVTQDQMAPHLYTVYELMLKELRLRPHLRVNVIDRTRTGKLAVRYRYNMDFDTDDALELSTDAGGVGSCYKSRLPVVIDLDRARREYSTYAMSKYQQALIRPSLRSLLCIPLFDPRGSERPVDKRDMIGVLNFDSDDDLKEEFQRLTARATELAVLLANLWVRLAEQGSVLPAVT